MASRPEPIDWLGYADKASWQTNKATKYNQTTPTGTVNWTAPSTPGGVWTQKEKLNPTQQKIFNTQQGTQLGAVKAAKPVLKDPTLDFSQIPEMTVNPGQTGQDAIMSRLSPQIERERDALHTQLVNWGLQPGTQAYDEAMQRQSERENDLLAQAANYGIGLDTTAHRQGVSDQQAAINTPLNALNTMGGYQDQYSPGSGQQSGAGPNYLSALMDQYNQQWGDYNASQANKTDWLGLATKALPLVTNFFS